MKISTKAKKLTRILGTTFGLISVPLLSSLVLLNPAHAEGDDTICNQSGGRIMVTLRALNDSGQKHLSARNVPVRAGACKTIFWEGADGLEGNVTEWILVSDRNGPISSDRYAEGVNQSETRGAWVLMKTGHVTVR